MITAKDIKLNGGTYEDSLSLLAGKQIKDVAGYISAAFGRHTLVFKISYILFEDGSKLYVEGEHDIPYIGSQWEREGMAFPNLADEALTRLWCEDNPEECK